MQSKRGETSRFMNAKNEDEKKKENETLNEFILQIRTSKIWKKKYVHTAP